MAIIDPDGLFNGDRLAACSIPAQLHWTRLFLASDGFGRLEINYARIVGTAYPRFNPLPSETEIQSYIQEYSNNHLLFLFKADSRIWGQWDTKSEFLKRYKTAADRRSPAPPEPEFTNWKRSYRQDHKAFPKSFGNISEYFLHGGGVGVGVGVGKNICASDDARLSIPTQGNTPTSQEQAEKSDRVGDRGRRVSAPLRELTPEQERWFATWWEEYWLRKAKKDALQGLWETGQNPRAVRAGHGCNTRPKTRHAHQGTGRTAAPWRHVAERLERWTDEITHGGSTRPRYRTADDFYEEFKD